MKTDYKTVAVIRSQLDNPGPGGFMRMANAWIEGRFNPALAWRYMRDVYKLPRSLFPTFVHHFRVAVETEAMWRAKESYLPSSLVDYMAGKNLPGVHTDLRPMDLPSNL